uniref:Ninja-family protein n=1 Tax=Elaeis guineensis var. tenera TaxID=51953 RepID=A0A6I9Q9M5_ELAGV|nr:uncharacterized protein LOC105032389 [Elaeis guineensis]
MKRMEFSDSGTADGGVELSLGLSIGGSSRRATNTGPVRHGAATLLGSGEGLPFDGGDHLRRREAKKNGFFGGGNGVPVDDRAAQEVQALELRARNREAREREAFAADRRGRESDGRIGGIARIPCPHPNNQNPVAYGSHPFTAMAMQYPYHRVQYLPIPNGLGFSFVMPCWAPAVSRVASNGSTDAEMNVLQQVARRISPVSVPAVSADGGISGARYLDMKGGNGIGVNGAPLSINSPRSCSSGLSDHKSGSLPGSCISTDTRSHSTHTMAEKPGSQPSSQVSNSQRHASPLPKGSDEGTEKIITSTAGSSLVLNSATSAMGKLDRATSVNKPISSAEDQNPNGSSSLPRMPYVSTTGNGPNGRTITGFLYTYTKSEVSIICVCHGSSFSPEEFVRHAGGTNIAHPLRQIVVVP